MSAPNSSDQGHSEQLLQFVEGLNNFECSDSGSDDGFVFTAVTTQQARDFISGKSKGDIGKGEVMGKGDMSKGDIGKGDISKGNVIFSGKSKGDIGKGDIGKGEVIVLGKGKSKD